MKKSRNTNKKQQKKAERIERKRRIRNRVIIICSVLLILIITAVIIISTPKKIVFTDKDGDFVDPTTGVTFVPVTPFVYEANDVFDDSDKVYGYMDGDEVYTIKGASKKEWLARKLTEGLYTIYCAESITPPELDTFACDSVTIWEDDYVNVLRGTVSDEKSISAVISEYLSSEPREKPENIKAVYNLRFTSEEYPFLYYCVKFVRTENSDYYCSHEDGEYYSASDIISSVLEAK